MNKAGWLGLVCGSLAGILLGGGAVIMREKDTVHVNDSDSLRKAAPSFIRVIRQQNLMTVDEDFYRNGLICGLAFYRQGRSEHDDTALRMGSELLAVIDATMTRAGRDETYRMSLVKKAGEQLNSYLATRIDSESRMLHQMSDGCVREQRWLREAFTLVDPAERDQAILELISSAHSSPLWNQTSERGAK